jgi:hypothetical protein
MCRPNRRAHASATLARRAGYDPSRARIVDRQKLEALFEDLWVEVYQIETSLMLHSALFRDPEAAAAIRATAPASFRVIGAALTDAVLLATHRLLEPGARRGRRTASIETLLSHLPPEVAPLRRELRKTLTALRGECRGLAELRHRYIAHRDYSVVLEEEPSPVRVKGRSLLATIGGFARILTAISERCGLDLPYQPGEVTLDADRLIARLRSE